MYHLYIFGGKKEKSRSRDPSSVRNPSKKKRKKKEEKMYEYGVVCDV